MASGSGDSFVYDRVPYPTGAFAETHPRRLATLAALYGLRAATAPSFAGARILELGCGSGGNLIPMAYSLPQASLLGVDLAAGEIALAQKTAEHHGVTNVTFRCLDICALTTELGTFDYILAHGVYSWVPPAVQDRLLWICGNLLRENGVAYVSYNTLPGGRIRQLVADMMKYHVRNESAPAAQIAQSRALMQTLVDSASPQDAQYRELLRGENERLAKLPSAVFFHDDLAACNEALFLHEFVARAARHGLRYLADAEFASMHAHRFPRSAAPLLSATTDRVEFEQYLDFLSCRNFRRTLLCRAEVALAPAPLPPPVEHMWAVSYATTEATPAELGGTTPIRFRNRAGVVVGLGDVLAKIALGCLIAASPRAVHFTELATAIGDRLRTEGITPPAPAALTEELSELLVMLYSGDMVELYVQIPEVATVPGEKPLASALARMQARDATPLVDLWHRNLAIDDAQVLRLVALLDGTRDQEALVRELGKTTESQASAPDAPDAVTIATLLQRLAHLGVLLK
jgi:SAM-dependent methyltransferase